MFWCFGFFNIISVIYLLKYHDTLLKNVLTQYSVYIHAYF